MGLVVVGWWECSRGREGDDEEEVPVIAAGAAAAAAAAAAGLLANAGLENVYSGRRSYGRWVDGWLAGWLVG